MINTRTVIGALLAMALAACGSADEVQKLPEAPKRDPMALDPNPPMAASDIDQIVNQHRSAGVGAPATNGNTSDAATKGN